MVNTKRPTETFLVATAAQTTIPVTGTLYDSSTLNVNLGNGQLGIVSDSPYGSVAQHSFTDATPTITEAPIIRLYQGTANSGSIASATPNGPLAVEPYIASNPINGKETVRITKQAYREPMHNVWVVGAAAGGTDDINVLSNTVYTISMAFRGRRIVESHSTEEGAVLHGTVTTPDFTATGLNLNNAQAIDWITTNLAYNINRNSKLLNVNSRFPANWPILALLIDTDGVTGTAIGGVDPIAAGDTIAVVNTSTGTRNVVLTEALATSIKNAAIAATGEVIADVTWSIVTIDLSEAGEVSSSIGEAIMLIALDEPIVYKDRIPQVKTSIEVGLKAGFDFNTVYLQELEYADEGQGQWRPLNLLYENTHGQRKYNLRHTEDPIVEYPSPIVEGQSYVVYNILHGNAEQVDTFNTVYSPYREIVCVPRYSTGTTAHPAIALLDTAFNAWLASGNNGTVLSLD